MHHTRHALRPAASHCGGRAARYGPHHFGRGMAHWTPFAPHFGRFPSHSESAPLFRLFDDFAFRGFDNFFPALINGANARPFPAVHQPRFDIKEVENAYELRGELPGVRNEELSVEFTDAQTLVIKGRTDREATSGAPTASSEVNNTTTPDDTSETASIISSSSYQKPSVEDAGVAESSVAGAATPTTSAAATEQPAQSAATEQQPADNGRYWMSERFIGEFQRTFSFPAPVDQDAVRASLRDGILTMSVPKATVPTARRINVE